MDPSQKDAASHDDAKPGADAPPPPPRHIEITQNVGSMVGGEVAGLKVGQVSGDLTVESTVNQIENKIVQGDYVDRRTITNNILTLNDPHALDEIVQRLAALLNVDQQVMTNPGAIAVPEHVSKQIEEVTAAQKEASARGVPLSAPAAYQLGMLAAFRRDYDAALDYFRAAIHSDPNFTDAYQGLAWLQQALAKRDLESQDYARGTARLQEAREAALHTDPLDLQALAQRGYIAQTLAEIAGAQQRQAERKTFLEEAARIFARIVEIDPKNPSAHNGLGNIEYSLGHLDGAIRAYTRAIKLAPSYAEAYNDLALAYEDKMKADLLHLGTWCEKALAAWRQAYALAPGDPTFSAEHIAAMEQRIAWWQEHCPQYRTLKKKPARPKQAARGAKRSDRAVKKSTRTRSRR